MAGYLAVVLLIVGCFALVARGDRCKVEYEVDLTPIAEPVLLPPLRLMQSGGSLGDAEQWSMGLCTGPLNAPPSVGLASCGTSAFLFRHSVATGNCLDAFDVILEDPAALPDGSSTVVQLQSTRTGRQLNVTMQCSASLTDSTVTTVAMGPAGATYSGSDEVDSISLVLASRHSCRLNTNFCERGRVHCADRTLTCLGDPGTCIKADCLKLSKREYPKKIAVDNVDVFSSVVVSDCRGRIVPGLTTADFIATLNGTNISPNGTEEAVLVQSSQQSSASVVLSLALDQSASVSLTNRSDMLIRASRDLLQSLSTAYGTTRIGLFTFDGSPDIAALPPSYSSDIPALLDALTLLPRDNGDIRSTNLYGAVQKSAEATNAAYTAVELDRLQHDTSAPTKRVLVVFTDGEDTAGRVYKEDSIRAAEQFRALNGTVFVVGLGERDDSVMEQVATPANYYRVNTSDELSGVFADIGKQVALSTTRYFAGYCTPLRSGIHALTLSLNTSRLGLSALPNTLYWVFGAHQFKPGCTADTLAAGAKQFDSLTPATRAMRVLNTSTPLAEWEVPASDRVLYVEVTLAPYDNGTVRAVAPQGLRLFAAEVNSTNCPVVSQYCHSSSGMSEITLPAPVSTVVAQLPPTTNTSQTVTLRLIGRSLPPPVQPPPTSSPTSPAPAGDDSDPFPTWAILLIIALVLILLAVAFYCFFKYRTSAATAQQLPDGSPAHAEDSKASYQKLPSQAAPGKRAPPNLNRDLLNQVSQGSPGMQFEAIPFTYSHDSSSLPMRAYAPGEGTELL